MTPYRFILDLDVENESVLFAAARQHPDCTDDRDLLNDDDTIDVGACLIMLLDPGHLAGCDVHGSTVESNSLEGA